MAEADLVRGVAPLEDLRRDHDVAARHLQPLQRHPDKPLGLAVRIGLLRETQRTQALEWTSGVSGGQITAPAALEKSSVSARVRGSLPVVSLFCLCCFHCPWSPSSVHGAVSGTGRKHLSQEECYPLPTAQSKKLIPWLRHSRISSVACSSDS